MTTADAHYPETHTRRGAGAGAWFGMVVSAIVLACLVVFMLQNTESVRVQFVNWHFSQPVGITMLLSAIAGAIVTGLTGGLRALLRRRH